MYEAKTELMQSEQYSLLKNFSTDSEKDKLLVDILSENAEYESKEEQVAVAFGEWSTIQKRKISFGIDNGDSIGLMNTILAISIKMINPDEITVCIRDLSNNKLEYWIICEKMDCDILDKVYDIYERYINKLAYSVEFVFTSKNQFVGEEHIKFMKKI